MLIKIIFSSTFLNVPFTPVTTFSQTVSGRAEGILSSGLFSEAAATLQGRALTCTLALGASIQDAYCALA